MITAAITAKKKMNWTKFRLYLGSLLLSIHFIAFLFSFSSGYSEKMNLSQRLAGPSAAHWFGQDDNGSDVLEKVIYGSKVSLTVGFSVITISLLIGLVIGSLAGFGGRYWDIGIMRLIDILNAFPGFLLALCVMSVMGPSVWNLVFSLCITGWTGYARLVRGEVLHLKEKEYVLAVKSYGAGPLRQVVAHVWPNLIGVLVVQSTFTLAGTIIAESGLSFLGLGAPPQTPTWGSLLYSGRKYLSEAPHLSIIPSLCILTLVLGFNLIGDALRDQFDPKKIK